VYERPRTAFVAGFMGEANVFETEGGRRVAVRPERMELLRSGASVPTGRTSRPGEVLDLVYLGDRSLALVRLETGADVRVAIESAGAADAESARWTRGDRALVAWRPADAHPLEGA
jgi:ABC-type Fe3+/spermidine/putrescine transport system ATPase subunit